MEISLFALRNKEANHNLATLSNNKTWHSVSTSKSMRCVLSEFIKENLVVETSGDLVNRGVLVLILRWCLLRIFASMREGVHSV